MRAESVDAILAQVSKVGLPAELHVEPDGELSRCFVIGSLGPRAESMAEEALRAAMESNSGGVLVIGLT